MVAMAVGLRSHLPASHWVWQSLGLDGPGVGVSSLPQLRQLQPTHAAPLSCADSCSFALHARGKEVTRFTTPGFPDSPYPARARCQWTLRGDAGSVLSLTFRSFDVAPCDGQNSDLVTVYNSLSPVEPHTVVR